MFSVVSTTGCTIHTMGAWQKCGLSFRTTWLPSSVLGFWKVLYVQSPKKRAAHLMKTPFQANCKLHGTSCILMSLHMESDSCDHPGVGIPYFHRKKHLEELYILCLAVKETFYWHFLVTTFVNLVTNKINSVASTRRLPKKVHCGPWIDHPSSFIEDIIWWREDMNFMFEWQEPQEHKIHIFKLTCNVLFII